MWPRIRLHGYRQSIIIDQDHVFMSQFWVELLRNVGTRLKFSSVYPLQTGDQIEGVNWSSQIYLQCFYVRKPRD